MTPFVTGFFVISIRMGAQRKNPLRANSPPDGNESGAPVPFRNPLSVLNNREPQDRSTATVGKPFKTRSRKSSKLSLNEIEADVALSDNANVVREFTCPDPDTPPLSLNLKTVYFQEVARSPRLSRREEKAITELAAAGGEGAAATLATSYLRMVIKLASTYARRLLYPGTVYLDLIQEGNIALLLAARRFSPNYGAPFYSYAHVAVERAIRRALGKNLKRFSDLPIEETLSEKGCVETDVLACATVQRLLRTLRPLERKVIELRFGLLNGKRHTLREVSSLVGINRHKVRQIEETAITAMRKVVDKIR